MPSEVVWRTAERTKAAEKRDKSTALRGRTGPSNLVLRPGPPVRSSEVPRARLPLPMPPIARLTLWDNACGLLEPYRALCSWPERICEEMLWPTLPLPSIPSLSARPARRSCLLTGLFHDDLYCYGLNAERITRNISLRPLDLHALFVFPC